MLQKTGRDSRLLSLAGLVCFKGTLDTGSTATRSALAVMLGIGRRLRSNVDKARATRWPIDVLKVWSAPWSDAESAFQRDAARKRLVLQEMRPDEINWAAPSAHVPDEHAGVAVQATVAFPVLNDDSSAGVVLRRWYPDTRSDRKPDETLYAQITARELRLYEYDNNKNRWQLIDHSLHGGVAERQMSLRRCSSAPAPGSSSTAG